MEETLSKGLFSLRVDPDGQIVCVIGDEHHESVGFFPTEEIVKLFRDLFILMKAISDFEEFGDIIQMVIETCDEAWDNRVLRDNE